MRTLSSAFSPGVVAGTLVMSSALGGCAGDVAAPVQQPIDLHGTWVHTSPPIVDEGWTLVLRPAGGSLGGWGGLHFHWKTWQFLGLPNSTAGRYSRILTFRSGLYAHPTITLRADVEGLGQASFALSVVSDSILEGTVSSVIGSAPIRFRRKE